MAVLLFAIIPYDEQMLNKPKMLLKLEKSVVSVLQAPPGTGCNYKKSCETLYIINPLPGLVRQLCKC